MSLPSVKSVSQPSITRTETPNSEPAGERAGKDASHGSSAVLTIHSRRLQFDKIPMDRRTWERWFEALLTGLNDRKWMQSHRK